jgi:hypothetical protein
MTSEAIDACARLQLTMESGEQGLFQVRQDLLHAEESLALAKLDYLTVGKTEEAKKIVLQLKATVFHLRGIKERCEQVQWCTDNCVDLMEMTFPGITNGSREHYEQLVVQANQPIEDIIGEMIAAPGVCEVLRHDEETPVNCVYPNPLAHPALEHLWNVPKTEGST